jgi:TRAP-type C4-dicarboxylate transport system substrate-binding protein
MTIHALTSDEQAQVTAASAPLVAQWITKYPQDKDLMAAIQAAVKG